MVRVRDLAQSLRFYCDALGLKEVRRTESEKGRFNCDAEDYGSARTFGHLAFAVDDIYATCAVLQAAGVTINRPPLDGHLASIRSPDLISIELLQKGAALAPREPSASMQNTGVW